VGHDAVELPLRSNELRQRAHQLFQTLIALGKLAFVSVAIRGPFLPTLLVQLENIVAVLSDE
jgi:hypothetical protein